MAEIRNEPIDAYYVVGEELGRGRFAVVRKCTSKKTGEVFAGKFVRKARQGRSAREQLLLEIEILHISDHPKMVRLYDVFETRTEMVLVLEYAPGGDLHRHCLEQVETVRTEKEICYLIRQIVEAVRYLHENHVVHLDLKPENILLKTDSRFPEIRLIDFGLSRKLDMPYSQFDIVGTPEYVAPEVLSYEPLDVNADMWSIGVVTYVLLSGISPFAGDDIMETYANIGQVDYDFEAEEFDDISDEAKDFIDKLLIRQQKKRMSARGALEHAWLNQLADGIKAEDIADAIKAESIIPVDVLSKAAELDPVEEETVSDAESEDYLSRGSMSSPEEEAVHDEGKEEVSSDTAQADVIPEVTDIEPQLNDHEQESEHALSEEETVSSINRDDHTSEELEDIKDREEQDTKNEEEEDVKGREEQDTKNEEEEDVKDREEQDTPKEKRVDSQYVSEDSQTITKDSLCDTLEHLLTEKDTDITPSVSTDIDTSINSDVEVKQDTFSEVEPAEKAHDTHENEQKLDGLKEELLKDKSSIVSEDDSNFVEVHSDDKGKVEQSAQNLSFDKVSDEPSQEACEAQDRESSGQHLYEDLLSDLGNQHKGTEADTTAEDSALEVEFSAERKKSSAIDIEAIIGSLSNDAGEGEAAGSQDSPIRRKTSFNIDDILAKTDERTVEVTSSVPTVNQNGKEISGSNRDSRIRKQLSAEKDEHQKTSKVKAAAAIFAQNQNKQDTNGKVSPCKVEHDIPRKLSANRTLRSSFENKDPKIKAPLEKSRSVENGDPEKDKSNTRSHGVPVQGLAQVSKGKVHEHATLVIGDSSLREGSKGPISNQPTTATVSSPSVGTAAPRNGRPPVSTRITSDTPEHSRESPEPKRPSSLRMSSKVGSTGSPTRSPTPNDVHTSSIKGVRQGIAAQMASKFSGKEAETSPTTTRKDINKGTKLTKDRETTPSTKKEGSQPLKVSQRVQELSTSPAHRMEHQTTSQARGSPERSVSPSQGNGASKLADLYQKSRESAQIMKVSDRVKRAEVMFKKEDSKGTKPVIDIGKGAPMKLVLGETFKFDISANAGMQLGTANSHNADSSKSRSMPASSRNAPTEQLMKGKTLESGRKIKIPPPLENATSSETRRVFKQRSKTDSEALKKAAELIRSTSESNDSGRRRQPSMAEMRGKNPSVKNERGSPSSPRKSYRRLYVTHVKGSKTLEIAEGALNDVAEVKQKVDDDGLKVQLVMKLPQF